MYKVPKQFKFKYAATCFMLFCASIVTNGQVPYTLWGYGLQVDVHEIATDAIGNVYVLGGFVGTVDMDPGPGVDIWTGVSNTWDICLLKFNAEGQYLWGRQYGGASSDLTDGNDQGIGLGVDQQGNIYFGGNYSSLDVDFDPSANIVSIQGGGVIVTKLSSNGLLLWARQLDTEIPYAFGLQDISIDNAGNTVCSVGLGSLAGTLDLDPTEGEVLLPLPIETSRLVWRLDAFGNYTWHKLIQGVLGSSPVSTDEAGSVYVAGGFIGSVNVGTTDSPVTLISLGARDVLLCKYSSTGGLLWARTISALSPSASAAAWSMRSKGDQVLIGGQFTESFDFDPGLPSAPQVALGIDNWDGYLASYSSVDGQFVRAQKLGDIIGYDAVQSVNLDEIGNAYAIGIMKGSVDFDAGPGIAVLNVGLSQANYVAKWGPLGDAEYVFTDYTQAVQFNALATGSGSDLFFGGATSGGQVDIDPSPSTFPIAGSVGWFGKYEQLLGTGLFPVMGNIIHEGLNLLRHADGRVELSLPAGLSGGAFTLIDATGRLIEQQRPGSYAGKAIFEMVAKPSGVYLFQWIGNDGQLLSVRAVHY